MYIEAIIIGFIIGIIRNGRLSNFADMRFKGTYLMIAAFIAFNMPYVFGILDISIESPQLFTFAGGVLAIIVAMMNFEKNGMKFIILGGLLNLIIMGLNHFMMPVDLVKLGNSNLMALQEAINAGAVINYTDIAGGHFLSAFLGKIIVMPVFYPFSKLLSVGDIIMSIGIVLLIQGEMKTFSSKMRGSMVTFGYNSRTRM